MAEESIHEKEEGHSREGKRGFCWGFTGASQGGEETKSESKFLSTAKRVWKEKKAGR